MRLAEPRFSKSQINQIDNLAPRVKFKIASGGKWSFEIEKKDGPVKLLIEQILSYLPPMP